MEYCASGKLLRQATSAISRCFTTSIILTEARRSRVCENFTLREGHPDIYNFVIVVSEALCPSVQKF